MEKVNEMNKENKKERKKIFNLCSFLNKFFENLKKKEKVLFSFLIKNRNYLSIFSFFVFPLVLLLLLFIVPEKYEFLKELGSLAFKLLVFILIIKPIIKIFNLKSFEKYLIFRKELGVIVFYLAFFHSLIIFYITDFNYYLVEKILFSNFGYLFGLIALIILFLLFITSNNLSMKILKKNWKKLHYLVYLVPLLVVLHLIFLKVELEYLGIIVVFYLLKVLEWKKVEIDLIPLIKNKLIKRFCP